MMKVIGLKVARVRKLDVPCRDTRGTILDSDIVSLIDLLTEYWMVNDT